MGDELNEAERFFYEHGNYSWKPKLVESEEEGKVRCARSLAAAERRLVAGPFYVTTDEDSDPWDGEVEWGGPVWVVSLWSVEGTSDRGNLVGSVGGVGCEAGDPYLRVIAAQLALDL